MQIAAYGPKSLPGLLGLLLIIILFYSCRKNDLPEKTLHDEKNKIEKFLTIPVNASKELLAISADIRKREQKNPFLAKYISKNGYPLWDRALSNLPVSQSVLGQSSSLNQNSNTAPTQTGIFFIPLQNENTAAISSYLVVYKRNDTSFQYRSYNRNYVESVHPQTDSIRQNGKNILSVFGYFEKHINNAASFTTGAPYNMDYSNVNMSIREVTNDSAQTRLSFIVPSCMHIFEAELIIEYPDGTIETGLFTIVINDCPPPTGGTGSTDGAGGTGGTGSGGFGGGSTGGGGGGTSGGSGSGGGNGYYWDEACQCMALDPWWDGSGGGSGFSPTITYLVDALGLTYGQAYWLSLNPDRANEVYNYLLNTSEATATQISTDHINQMMTDVKYFTLVLSHSINGELGKVWWEDSIWLSNPDNFNLDVDAMGNYPQPLTAAEKILIKKYPLAAALIFENASTAKSYTISKMGSNGLNDKTDAFRHAFFQALNTVTAGVGASLAQQFANAHESEVPTQLAKEKDMDLFNNAVGISYGQNVSFWASVNSIADGILVKLNNGELRYLYPIDYNDPNFYGTGGIDNSNTATHGITYLTVLTPTNQ